MSAQEHATNFHFKKLRIRLRPRLTLKFSYTLGRVIHSNVSSRISMYYVYVLFLKLKPIQTYSGIKIRIPITTIGIAISNTVPIGLRFCGNHKSI